MPNARSADPGKRTTGRREEGKKLPNLEAAKAEALREVREMLQASIIDSGTINLCHRIDVRDEAGRISKSLMDGSSPK